MCPYSPSPQQNELWNSTFWDGDIWKQLSPTVQTLSAALAQAAAPCSSIATTLHLWSISFTITWAVSENFPHTQKETKKSAGRQAAAFLRLSLVTIHSDCFSYARYKIRPQKWAFIAGFFLEESFWALVSTS